MIHSNAIALTIAGSDPSGGAGLQADLKTFQQLGVYGASIVTLLTVQNTQSVKRVHILDVDLIIEQLEAVLEDLSPRAIKIGALGSPQVVEAVADRIRDVFCPIVIDPVLVSKHGHALASAEVVEAYQRHLLPHAYLVTPNRFETERLTGLSLTDDTSAFAAARRLHDFGIQYALVKWGDVHGISRHLFCTHGDIDWIDSPRENATNTHGTGCILAAAITAKLALGETDVKQAVRFGIDRTLETIRFNSSLGLGIHPAEIRAMTRGK